jgi:hypothetical protein
MRRDLDAEDGFPEWLIPQFDGFLQLDHFNFHPMLVTNSLPGW